MNIDDYKHIVYNYNYNYFQTKIIEQHYKNIIIQLIHSKPKNYTQMLFKFSYKYIGNYIINKYPQLEHHSYAEYCYWFLYDLIDFPKCKLCNKKLYNSFNNIFVGYGKGYCSNKCASNSKDVQNKRFYHV